MSKVPFRIGIEHNGSLEDTEAMMVVKALQDLYKQTGLIPLVGETIGVACLPNYDHRVYILTGKTYLITIDTPLVMYCVERVKVEEDEHEH